MGGGARSMLGGRTQLSILFQVLFLTPQGAFSNIWHKPATLPSNFSSLGLHHVIWSPSTLGSFSFMTSTLFTNTHLNDLSTSRFLCYLDVNFCSQPSFWTSKWEFPLIPEKAPLKYPVGASHWATKCSGLCSKSPPLFAPLTQLHPRCPCLENLISSAIWATSLTPYNLSYFICFMGKENQFIRLSVKVLWGLELTWFQRLPLCVVTMLVYT